MLISSIAVPAAAQTAAPNPPAQGKTVLLGSQAFAQLVEGKQIRVTTKDGVQSKGFVTSLSSNAMVVDGKTIPFNQVTRVEKVSHLVRATLAGLGVGFGIGLVMNSYACGDDEACPAAFGAATAGGALLGFGLGAAAYGFRNVIYDATKATSTIAVAPIVTPTRKGVAVAISWR